MSAPAPWAWLITTAVVGVTAAWLLAHPHGQAEAVALAAGPTAVAVMVGLWRVETEVKRGKEDE
jgi:hypothetical protein